MSAIPYLDCENNSESSETLFAQMLYLDENSELILRVFNNNILESELFDLNCDDQLDLDTLFRKSLVYDNDNNLAINII